MVENTRLRERRKALERELRRYVDLLVRHYQPERIILFGSLAQDRVHEDSDIDLVVVAESDKGFLDRLEEAYVLLDPRESLDLFIYTPQEFQRLLHERPFVREEVLQKGKVLYERKKRARMVA